jgi:hypothetical protein
MVDVIHLSGMGVTEIAKSTNLKGCPHTFVYIVYMLFFLNQLDHTHFNLIFKKYTVPVISLDTPTHSRVFLYLTIFYTL